ncbi:MAG TPA: UPF0175 family protein [Thermoanaerobaculia bacterium]
MQITLELPEEIAKRLEAAWQDVSRGALEAVAVEGYRDGALTRDQVGRLLGLSFWETEAFLKERQAYLAYTEEDFEQDRRALTLTPRDWEAFLVALDDTDRPRPQLAAAIARRDERLVASSRAGEGEGTEVDVARLIEEERNR